MDKWTRAKNALHHGVDLVIELPTVYSLNSAEYFAEGAIKLLNATGITDYIVFGSEKGTIDNFHKIGEVYAKEPEAFVLQMKENLSEGSSFPKARRNALIDYLGEELNLDSKPNNILGIEYLKALYNTKSEIKAETIKRINNDYNDLNLTGEISSATAIRKTLQEHWDIKSIKKSVPINTLNSLKAFKNDLVFKEAFENLIFYKLRSMTSEQLAKIHDVSEGLENRIKEKALTCNNLEDLILEIKSKRYTYTRIQRILFKTLLTIEKADVSHNPRYIRILGFNKKGQELIRKINAVGHLPVITNLKNYQPQDSVARRMIDKDILATNIYQLAKNKKTGNLDFLNSPVIIK
jgi:predicted nucleotidyltransferase